jgi:hypothetical protein
VNRVLNSYRDPENKEKLFKTDNLDIKRTSEDKDLNSAVEYVIKMKEEASNKVGFAYSGPLITEGNILKREKFGRNKFENGDVYIGYWGKIEKETDEELMEKGIYKYANKRDPSIVEIYVGGRNKKKQRENGIYLIKNPHNKSLQAFIIKSASEQGWSGLFYHYSCEENTDHHQIYIGHFKQTDDHSKIIKSDKDALYYSSDIKIYYAGHIEDKKLVQGSLLLDDGHFMAFFRNEEGKAFTRPLQGNDAANIEKKLKEFKDHYQPQDLKTKFDTLVDESDKYVSEEREMTYFETFKGNEVKKIFDLTEDLIKK